MKWKVTIDHVDLNFNGTQEYCDMVYNRYHGKVEEIESDEDDIENVLREMVEDDLGVGCEEVEYSYTELITSEDIARMLAEEDADILGMEAN